MLRLLKSIAPPTRCASGRCITQVWVCDNYEDCCEWGDDCGDKSDEEGCTTTSTTISTTTSTTAQGCSASEFMCDSGTCIALELTCNKRGDCGIGCRNTDSGMTCGEDTSDEDGCPKRTCATDEFSCDNGYCVPRHSTCDGIDDCGDNSDESTSAGCAGNLTNGKT